MRERVKKIDLDRLGRRSAGDGGLHHLVAPRLHESCEDQRRGFDVALFLIAATSLLEGRRPAVDLVDVNPPLMIYLDVAPALLARLTGWSVDLAAQLCVLAVIVASLFAFRVLLSLAPGNLDTAERAVFSGFWILASLVTYAANEFGQREHIFVLLCTPFLLLRLSRHGGAKLRPVLALALGPSASPAGCRCSSRAMGPTARRGRRS